MLKLIKYLWYRYILHEGFKVIMRYRMDIGTTIKFAKSEQKSIILWNGKKDAMGYFNHYLIPVEEDKVKIMEEYFVNKFLAHKHGTWH